MTLGEPDADGDATTLATLERLGIGDPVPEIVHGVRENVALLNRFWKLIVPTGPNA